MKEAFPDTARRLHAYIPDGLKLIYIVRHPLRRIESFWMQLRAISDDAHAHYNFETALRVNRSYLVDTTNYWQQIKLYIEFYGSTNVMIIFFEDLRQDQGAVLRRCFEFLGADPEFRLPDEQRKVGPSENLRLQSATLSRLRRIPFWRTAIKLVPYDARRRISDRLFFKPAPRPKWTDGGRRRVLDILGDDTRRILEYCGKPPGFWDLSY